jgi:hypothetical protein
MRQVPSKVKSEMKNISSYVSKTGKEIRKIGTRTNSKK